MFAPPCLPENSLCACLYSSKHSLCYAERMKNGQEVLFCTRTLEQEESLSSVPAEEKEQQVQKEAQFPESHFVVQPRPSHLD